MNKTIINSAILAGLILGGPAFSDASDNSIITRIYDAAQTAVTNLDVSDRYERKLVEEHTDEFPMIPQEAGIKDFPEAIDENEQNTATLIEFYNKVGEAYLQAAEQMESEANAAHERVINADREMALENMRTQKGFATTASKRFVSKDRNTLSRRHFPHPVLSQSRHFSSDRYNSARLKMEEYTLKGFFYRAMADALQA
ncbi:MAG: hypothetical protein ACPGXY_01155 [Alphaproteobacteria bacterium]